MSFYNMLHGVNMCTFYVAPLIVWHPQDNVPRFRDCFLGDVDHPEYEGNIHIFTRLGGGNRDSYKEEIKKLQEMPGFIADYDDKSDCTYATFVYAVPEKWKEDVEKLYNGKATETSEDYKSLIILTFPKLEAQLKEVFNITPPADGFRAE